ncbi:hypothetical protein EMQ25_07305 [Arsenicitalea aurantiaca]|uniref:MBL fold metallo-hydrolase n=1 Tax=Arsenicitalea aurantiaca TaxID=1783274 RepID=A0A433XFP9_9HYPH|nr:hypothetical protein [Arsenicitalea aurantiaca]RUT32931.1 hypothetical protein EMQ25_07305 [Arsenicitalea aurantiaca]
MKITWFGGTTVRVHLGGMILVVDAAGAPTGIDQAELLSGADRSVSLSSPDPSLSVIDPTGWRPRRVRRAIDENEREEPVELFLIGDGSLLIEAVGEPPLVLLCGPPPRFGRWADDSVLVMFGAGEEMAASATLLLDIARPRLIVLAAPESEVDPAISAIAEHLGGAGLVALETGLALEV